DPGDESDDEQEQPEPGACEPGQHGRTPERGSRTTPPGLPRDSRGDRMHYPPGALRGLSPSLRIPISLGSGRTAPEAVQAAAGSNAARIVSIFGSHPAFWFQLGTIGDANFPAIL